MVVAVFQPRQGPHSLRQHTHCADSKWAASLTFINTYLYQSISQESHAAVNPQHHQHIITAVEMHPIIIIVINNKNKTSSSNTTDPHLEASVSRICPLQSCQQQKGDYSSSTPMMVCMYNLPSTKHRSSVFFSFFCCSSSPLFLLLLIFFFFAFFISFFIFWDTICAVCSSNTCRAAAGGFFLSSGRGECAVYPTHHHPIIYHI